MQIRHGAHNRRHHRAPTHASHNKPGPTLSILPQPPHPQRNNSRKANRLEKQRHVQHRHTRIPPLRDRGTDKHDAETEVDEEDVAGPDEFHDGDADEAAHGESSLGAGEELCSQRAGGAGAGFRYVVDEVARDGDLGARVAELGEGGVEEAVLFAEGLDVGVGVCGFGLCVWRE